MTRGILIAGNESSLYSAITAEAAKRVEFYASALIPNRLPMRDGGLSPRTETAGGALPVPWNPSSAISARTLVLASENRLGQINNAILVCSPPSMFRGMRALEPEEIEILVDDHIKGWFFLIRELCLYFCRTGSGSLSLIAPETSSGNRNAQADLLGPPAVSSFMSFAGSVLASSVNEPFQVLGFSGSEGAEKADFAEWLFKIIDEGSKKYSGRWNKYSKLGFLR